ncbi:MAG: BatD family protein [Halioglobus sp.]
MRPIGKALRVMLVLLTLASGTIARAELTASVDRDRIAMGDVIRLTIAATANEPINNVDLRPLLQDFEILQRSNSSSTSVANGVSISSRQVQLDITPKREGTLRVPSMAVGRATTNYLLVSVGPATTASGDPLVSFEAELDTSTVYVQGQAILTLRIQQAINLSNRSVSEFTLDNAFVKPLEQKSFQRTIAGRPWLVHEIRYAIFPEKSGVLTIPTQTFSARESQPKRSMFDIGGTGKQLNRSSKTLTLNVKPRPDSYPQATWLPTSKLTVTEQWSTPPEQLRVGESATRRVLISAQGLQGAQLPPTLFPATAGLKYYPDQPVINDQESGSGLLGSREDSAALVPAQQGDWQIPEVRIPWWDTQAEKIRFAVLPARTITVAASLDAGSPALPLAPQPQTSIPVRDDGPISIITSDSNTQVWQLIAAATSLGWLLTIVYLIVKRKKPVVANKQTKENPDEATALKQLLAACATDNAPATREQLVKWAAALHPHQAIHSLNQIESVFSDPELSAQIQQLNQSLYSTGGQDWTGKELMPLIKRLRKQHRAASDLTQGELRLYPH